MIGLGSDKNDNENVALEGPLESVTLVCIKFPWPAVLLKMSKFDSKLN